MTVERHRVARYYLVRLAPGGLHGISQVGPDAASKAELHADVAPDKHVPPEGGAVIFDRVPVSHILSIDADMKSIEPPPREGDPEGGGCVRGLQRDVDELLVIARVARPGTGFLPGVDERIVSAEPEEASRQVPAVLQFEPGRFCLADVRRAPVELRSCRLPENPVVGRNGIIGDVELLIASEGEVERHTRIEAERPFGA